MKRVRIISGICIFVFVVSICGCSLADPDAGTDAAEDQLIGAFITSEYQQKLYATIEKNDSEDPADWDITFGNVEGINLFAPVWTDQDGESYVGSVCGEEVCDVNTEINVSDTEEMHCISGTIYMIPGQMDQDIAYYTNPVYQTPEGDIYLTSGQGISTSGNSSEGVIMTNTIEDKVEVTENGTVKARGCKVAVSMAVMYEPVKITVCQMNADHQVLETEVYQPGMMPETFAMNKNAAYMMVETEKKDLEGKTFTAREIYDLNEGEVSIETFYVLEDGILSRQETMVQ